MTAIGGAAPIPVGSKVLVILRGTEGLQAQLGSEVVVANPFGTKKAGLALSGKALGCDVVLTAEGSDGPVFYFDANAGVPGWASVGETKGDGDLTLPGLEPGVHVFKARTDALSADPVSVSVPGACASNTGWQGDAAIIDGNLVVPKEAAGSVWFYLSIDGRPALRVPASQDEAIGAGLVTPVGYALPALSGKRLDLEVWKATGNDIGPSAPAAKGSLDVPAGKTMTDIVGEPSALSLTVSTPDGPDTNYQLGEQDTPLTFDWTAASDRVGEVMWQVTTSPHTTGDHELVPTDLIAAGTSKLSSAEGPGTKGQFTINSEDIPGREPTGGEAVYQDSLKPQPKTIQAPTTPTTVTSLPKQSFGAIIDPTKVTEEVIAAAAVVDLPSFGDPVYIRVVAKPQGPAVGSASPNVRVTLPVPQGQNGKKVEFKLDTAKFDPGRRPNAALAACAAVVVPWNGSGQTYTSIDGKSQVQYDPKATPPPGGWTPEARFTSVFYPTSRTYCPSDFPPPATCSSTLCDIWNGIEEVTAVVVDVLKAAYTVIATVYNGAIDTVVELAGELGLCEVANEAVDDEDFTGDCQFVLRTIARTAITIVLAYYGLPARLPPIEELEGIAKGELELVVVGAMEYYGVPCEELKTDPEALAWLAENAGEDPAIGEAAGDPCRALARYFVSKVGQLIADQVADGIMATTGLPSVAGIPGASMQLDSRGQATAAKLDLVMKVSKSNADASGLVCSVNVQPRVRRGQDKKGNDKYVFPIQSAKLLLTELAPLDGTGQWRGSVVLANTTPLEGRSRYFTSMEAYVTSAPGSPCDIQPFTIGPVELAAPAPR